MRHVIIFHTGASIKAEISTQLKRQKHHRYPTLNVYIEEPPNAKVALSAQVDGMIPLHMFCSLESV